MPKGNQLIKNNKRNRKENMKLKKNKGITLISLIITIILLLILVGVSLGIILQGNFFYKARRTAKMTDEKISSEGNTIEKGQNDWEQMEVDVCSHIWGEEKITLAPTCTTPGKKVRECENCGKTIEVETPALGHNYENRVCTRCGEEKPGCDVHTFGDWVTTTSATCTTNGTKKRTCTACGTAEVQEITKLGHNYVNRTCTRCGDVETLVVGANIDYHEYLSESGSTLTSSYTSTKIKRGSTNSSDSNAVFKVQSGSGIQWIILGEENGQIKITTKNSIQPVSGGYTSKNTKYLMFGGQNGWANFIDELNEVCAVYGRGKFADTTKYSKTVGTSGGRSFIMEDLGFDKLTRTPLYTYARHSDGKIYRYPVGATIDGSSTEGGKYTVFRYMSLDASTSTTEGQHTWNALSATNSSVTIYNYTYNGSVTLDASVCKCDTWYWLASRLYNVYPAGIDFMANSAGPDETVGWLFFRSAFDGNDNNSFGAVRPVVYLKSTAKLSNYSSTSGYTLSY